MKRFIGVIIIIAGIAAIVVWSARRFEQRSTEIAREQSELRLRAAYLERVAWLRNVPEEKAYRDEIGTFLAWYFKEVGEHMARFGGNRAFDDYLQELEERGKKTPSSKFEGPARNRIEDKRAAYEYTKGVFEQFRSKAYAPLWTATSRGMRLDIASADPVRMGPEEKIRLQVVAWGLPMDERVDEHKVRRLTSNASFRFTWRLFDDKQKLIGEMPGEGGPEGRIDWPERFVKFFPPVVLLGYYDVDKLPQNVKSAEITFNIGARSPTGGDMQGTYVWKLDVPAAWKLGAGEVWHGAQESIRPKEEIEGRGH